MALENIVGGKIERTEAGEFLVVERSLADLSGGKLRDFLVDNMGALDPLSMTRIFPVLKRLPENRMLFFDTENCGLGNHDPIFLIGMAHLAHNGHPDIRFRCLFARDYAEERAILAYFLQQIETHSAFFSYRGVYFDVPRMAERMKFTGVSMNGKGSLKDRMAGKHFDLYDSLSRTLKRRQIVLRSKRLQAVEQLLFHHDREDDLPGELIPKTYFEYVWGRERAVKKVPTEENKWREAEERAMQCSEASEYSPMDKYNATYVIYAQELGGKFRDSYYPGERIQDETKVLARMARVVEHNFIDILSTIAVLAYVVKNS